MPNYKCDKCRRTIHRILSRDKTIPCSCGGTMRPVEFATLSLKIKNQPQPSHLNKKFFKPKQKAKHKRKEAPPRECQPPLQKKQKVSQTNYALIYTMGACTVNSYSGDGAYAKWLEKCFCGIDSCVYVDKLILEGITNRPNDDIVSQIKKRFGKAFKNILSRGEIANTCGTIILNWHVRFTGRTNAWTGRGINKGLLQKLKRLAEKANKVLKIVYTVHESPLIKAESLPYADAIITLNSTVATELSKVFKETPIYRSCVPNLENSVASRPIDIISKIIGYQLNPDARAGANLFYAHLLKNKERQLASKFDTSKIPGVVIFGSITKRHGTTVNNVQYLAESLEQYLKLERDEYLKKYGPKKFILKKFLDENFKIIIAGSTSDVTLAEELKKIARGITGKELPYRTLNAIPKRQNEKLKDVKERLKYKIIKNEGTKSSRIYFHGKLEKFSELARCKYAISYDKDGFRTNASAMINVLRAGHLLIPRQNSESDTQLAGRAAKIMAKCESQENYYYALMAQQQKLFLQLNPEAVGLELSDIFLRIINDGESSMINLGGKNTLNAKVDGLFSAIDSIRGNSLEDKAMREQLKSMVLAIATRLIDDPKDEKALQQLDELNKSLGSEQCKACPFNYADYMPLPSGEVAIFLQQHLNWQICDVSGNNNNCLIHCLLTLTKSKRPEEIEEAGNRIRKQLVKENRTVHGALLYTYYHARRILELIREYYKPTLKANDYYITEHWTYNNEIREPDHVGDPQATYELHLWNSGGHYQIIQKPGFVRKPV